MKLSIFYLTLILIELDINVISKVKQKRKVPFFQAETVEGGVSFEDLILDCKLLKKSVR